MKILLFQPAPFFLKNFFSWPSSPKENQTNNTSNKTCLSLRNITLSVKADQLYRRTAFREAGSWSEQQRAGMGRSRKELSWGKAKHRQSWPLLVTYWHFSLNSTDLWTGWASVLPYLFFLLRISVSLVNYHTGESKALQPRQSPVAGKWCKLPNSHQPPLCQSTSTLTCSCPLPPPGPLPWGWGGPRLA